MPFDVMPDTTTPSLERLSYLLRHKELWPAGFRWDYSDCSTCAMGLAVGVWQMKCLPHAHRLAPFLRLSAHKAEAIFCHLHMRTGQSRALITPENVADAIDAYLAANPPAPGA